MNSLYCCNIIYKKEKKDVKSVLHWEMHDGVVIALIDMVHICFANLSSIAPIKTNVIWRWWFFFFNVGKAKEWL